VSATGAKKGLEFAQLKVYKIECMSYANISDDIAKIEDCKDA
jgi:hypothetical protein